MSAYRSFASFPIASMGKSGGETPLGVLVATSDRTHRFDRENTDILGQLADLIAMLLTLAAVDASRLYDAVAHNPSVAGE